VIGSPAGVIEGGVEFGAVGEPASVVDGVVLAPFSGAARLPILVSMYLSV